MPKAPPNLHTGLFVVAGLLCLTSLGLVGEQAYLSAKRAVANVLLERAYARHLEDGGPHRAWSWADFAPIAKIEWHSQDGVRSAERLVLSGSSGTSMAFGIGHVDGTTRPLDFGNCVLAGHRDTSFEFLKDVTPGDHIVVSIRGKTETFEVDDLNIVEADNVRPLAPSGDTRLTLITCYPFGGMQQSTKRYVVSSRLLRPSRTDSHCAAASKETRPLDRRLPTPRQS